MTRNKWRSSNPRRIRRGKEFSNLKILERFTFQNLVSWGNISAALQKFHSELYYGLEAQRTAQHAELEASLTDSTVSITKELDRWTRIVNYQYSDEPLSSVGSTKWVGGRFNYGEEIDSMRFHPFGCLYIAEDQATAFREKYQLPAGDDENRGITAGELAMERGSYSVYS